MLSIEKNDIKVSLNEQNGSIFIENGELCFNTLAAENEYTIYDARIENGELVYNVSRPEKKEGGVQLGEAIPDPETIVCARLSFDESSVKLTMSGNARFEKEFHYPPAFDVKKGDTHIMPYNEGVAIDADESDPNIIRYHDYKHFSCGFSVMAMWGLTRGKRDGAYLLCICETNYDAGLYFERDDDSLFRVRPYFLPQKSFWGYDRVLRFVVSEGGGITDMCKKYRAFAEKRGFVRTLKEKAQAVKNVEKMLGAADVWVFNDDAMNKLYNKDAKYTPPTKEQYARRREIADDMKKRGIDRVMWSIFDENVDPDTVKYVKDKGYLTTVYDVFSDVIPKATASLMTETRYNRCKPRLSYWPDSIAVTKDGQLMTAWQLMGKDGNYYYQNRMCDVECVKCAKDRISKLNREINVDGWFLDVVFNHTNECYSIEHPMTRREGLKQKVELTKVVEDNGLICGTEIGREDGLPYCVYNEGMLSISEWRSYQSGRRMAELYYGDEIDSNIEKYMLNPKHRVPLWELVYHDCMISYWYWGDSHNCCPELMPKRDLYLNLYGLPPIFSFAAKNYEKLADSVEASYKSTSPLALEVGYEKMTSFEYLSDDFKVQKTEFSNKVSVIVNFSEQDFSLENGEIVKANDKLIIRK